MSESCLLADIADAEASHNQAIRAFAYTEVNSITTTGTSLKDLTAGMSNYKDSLSGTSAFLPLVDTTGAQLDNADKQGIKIAVPSILSPLLQEALLKMKEVHAASI